MEDLKNDEYYTQMERYILSKIENSIDYIHLLVVNPNEIIRYDTEIQEYKRQKEWRRKTCVVNASNRNTTSNSSLQS